METTIGPCLIGPAARSCSEPCAGRFVRRTRAQRRPPEPLPRGGRRPAARESDRLAWAPEEARSLHEACKLSSKTWVCTQRTMVVANTRASPC